MRLCLGRKRNSRKSSSALPCEEFLEEAVGIIFRKDRHVLRHGDGEILEEFLPVPLEVPRKPQDEENGKNANDGADCSSDDPPAFPPIVAAEILNDEIEFFFYSLRCVIFSDHIPRIHGATCAASRRDVCHSSVLREEYPCSASGGRVSPRILF